MWTKLLGIKKIGIDDDFFELGGDSLLASRLISRLNETFQIDISVDYLFSRSTIAKIAEGIEEIIIEELK